MVRAVPLDRLMLETGQSTSFGKTRAHAYRRTMVHTHIIARLIILSPTSRIAIHPEESR